LSLPEITDTGEGTMGCLIDSSIWIMSGYRIGSGGSSSLNRLQISYSPEIGRLRIYGNMNRRCDTLNIIAQNIEIEFKNILDTGIYELLPEDELNEFTFSDYENSGFFEGTSGSLHVTQIDTTERIVSGLFSFKALDAPDIQDTMKVTLGRFDGTFN
jgi:hypothetical protein